jgi:hypothetical protein
MSVGLTGFRLLLCAGWAILLVVSIHAVSTMGLGAGGTVFLGDFAHPWRAQFDTDFSLHLLLVACWMIYRSKSWVVGLICAVLAINLGSLFTFVYLFVATLQAKGDMRKVLLGARAGPDPQPAARPAA